MELTVAPVVLQHDPDCYLCPGNLRAGGQRMPQYEATYVFPNDYAALLQEGQGSSVSLDSLLRAEPEHGICRVLCFDPRHDLTLATMSEESITLVVDLWAAQEAELGATANVQYVQIFENRGAMMGASNPHPHGQIWATEHVPNEPAAELAAQLEYYACHGNPLLSDYLKLELKQAERIVYMNDSWVALVPFWAVWPFELLLLPRDAAQSLHGLEACARTGLAFALKRVTAGYNRVFDTPFPYSMGFHAAPCDGQEHPEWLLHAHFYPPLLRSATVRKFMVGFELLGSPQRDVTPEVVAAILRRAMKP